MLKNQSTNVFSRRVGLLCGLAWSFVFLSCAPVLAQAAKLDASISAEEIFIGESVQLQLQLRNVENPAQPDLAPLQEQFDVQFETEQSGNSMSMIVINGSMRQSNTYNHVYAYRLTPKEPGRLTIPSVTLILDGKTIATRPLSIEVREIETQDTVVVETVASKTKVYPTQSFTVTLRVWVKPLPNAIANPLTTVRRKPPKIQVPWAEAQEGLEASEPTKWLQSMLARDGVGFSINNFTSQSGSLFDSPRSAVFELNQSRETRNGLDGKPIDYFRFELNREFTAMRTGNFSFGPAIVNGTFVTGFEGQEYAGRKIIAIAPKIEVEVAEIPTPRPPSFNGGIGRYNVIVSASPTKLKVGDPLTLSIDFSRATNGGPLDLLAAPKLDSVPDFLSNFDLVDANPTGKVEGDSKKFTYSIRPKRAGVTIPAIPWSIFDPNQDQFVETSTEPIEIDVSEASVLSNIDIVGAASSGLSSGRSGNGIKANREGLFQNIVDPSQVTNDRISIIPFVMIVAVCWSLSLLGSFFLMLRRRKPRAARDFVASRRSFLTQLASAKQIASTDPKTGIALLRTALVSAIAVKCRRQPSSMTASEAISLLRNTELDSDTVNQWDGLLQQLDSQQYGGVGEESLANSLGLAERLIRQLDSLPDRKFRLPSIARSTTAILPLLTTLIVGSMGMATDRGTNTSFQSQSQTQSLRHEDSIGEKRDRFQQALKQFESVQSPEDFAESARIFESIQGDDFESGAVYYNMGNAFLRAGQYGKAVLSFRKAQRFRTNDPYLEANLRYAIQSAPGTLPAAPGAWYRSLLFWSDWLAPYPKLLLGSTALCLASLLSFWSTIKRRSGLRWLSLGLSLCFAILFLDGAWSATSSMKPLHGVITKETIARKGMAETYAPAFDKPLQDGAEFVILNRTNQWFFGRFEGVGDGWISRDAAAD